MTEEMNTNGAASAAQDDTQGEHTTTPEQLKISEQAEQLAAMQEQIEQLKLKLAIEDLRKGSAEPLGLGKLDVKRDAAVRAAGSNAAWHSLTPEDRAAAQGITVNYPDEEIRRYFGKGSNGMDAQRLATTNPSKYQAMRVLAIERGIY